MKLEAIREVRIIFKTSKNSEEVDNLIYLSSFCVVLRTKIPIFLVEIVVGKVETTNNFSFTFAFELSKHQVNARCPSCPKNILSQ